MNAAKTASTLGCLSLVLCGVAFILLGFSLVFHSLINAMTDVLLLVTNGFAFYTNRLIRKAAECSQK